MAFGAIIFLMFIGIFMLNWPYAPDEGLLLKIYFSDHWDWSWTKNSSHEEKNGRVVVCLDRFVELRAFFPQGRTGLPHGVLGHSGGWLWLCRRPKYSGFSCLAPRVVSGRLPRSAEWLPQLVEHHGNFLWVDLRALLALGLWVHRRHIATPEASSESISAPASSGGESIDDLPSGTGKLEFSEFFRILDNFADLAITSGMLSLRSPQDAIGPCGCLPVTLLPIAGKTLKHVVYDNKLVEEGMGWAFLLIVLYPRLWC